MFKKLSTFIAVFLVPLLSFPVYAQDTGTMPVPVFTDAGVGVVVSYDAAEGLYRYDYTISNPTGNSGAIWTFDINISRPRNGMELSSAGLTIPRGTRAFTFDEVYSDMLKWNPKPMVPVGLKSPPGLEPSGLTGWGGSISNGLAGFSGDPNILPGESQGGFIFISRGLPGIRDIKIEPDWMMVVEGSVTDEDVSVSRAVKQQLTVTKKTVGPTAPPGQYGMDLRGLLEKIYGYITESAALGWLADAALADSLRAKLDAAKQFMNTDDGTQAKTTLGEFMTLLDNASPAQRTSEGYGLLYYNAKYVKDRLPDTVSSLPPVYLLELETPYQTLPIGATGIRGLITATFTVNGVYWYWNFPMEFEITGPYEGTPFYWGGRSDGEGRWRLMDFINTIETTNKFVARATLDDGTIITSEPVEITWYGGPDLVVSFFNPPTIKKQGAGGVITVTESTKNIGGMTAGPSITRYYISDDAEIDPAVDTPLSERQVPSLDPDTASDSGEILLTLPAGLADGDYYMWACVDANNEVIEKVEPNNCMKNQVGVQVAIPINPNRPPDCTQASPGLVSLWPPYHDLFPIPIMGVTDPDGDAVTLTITAITQDEPINYVADGDTEPDGYGIGTSIAQIRAERAANRNGRVYAIQFSADDGKGGQCAGSVNVIVTHDEGGEADVVDDGQNYDSTQP